MRRTTRSSYRHNANPHTPPQPESAPRKPRVQRCTPANIVQIGAYRQAENAGFRVSAKRTQPINPIETTISGRITSTYVKNRNNP